MISKMFNKISTFYGTRIFLSIFTKTWLHLEADANLIA